MVPVNELMADLQWAWPSTALAGCVAAAGGTLGVPTLLKRHSLAALALPQAAAVGVAVALRWELSGWWMLPLAALAAALVIALVASARTAARADVLLSAAYVGGLCVSFLLLANAGAHVVEMQNRFVGMDVAVDPETFWWNGPVLLALGLVGALLWRRWVLLAQMPAVAELAGLKPVVWQYLFLALLAAMVMIGTNSQGVVMVLAALFLPAATVLPWTRRVPAAMASAAAVGVVLVAAGQVISIEMNWPFSQSVGGAGFAVLVASRLLVMLRK